MDLLLMSRRIGRVYIDVIHSNCQLSFSYSRKSRSVTHPEAG
jgi:hypothetical protein